MIYVLAIFATYRVAHMVVNEAGPFGLAEWLRTFIFERTNANSLWQEGINCIYCVSWWVAWPVAGMLRPSNILEFILLAQGLAGLVALVHVAIDYLRKMPHVRMLAEMQSMKE